VKRARPLLDVAIEREDWDTAALCLLLGAVKVLSAIPPETLEEMIEMLSETPRRRTERQRRGCS
jgi:hypothetical protein